MTILSRRIGPVIGMPQARLGGRCTIGPFLLDVNAQILLLDNTVLPVGRRAVALLLVLLEGGGEVVTKDVLITAAWNGQVVEESNLTAQIAALRRAFAAVPGCGAWIETLPRRGYRFVGPVAEAVFGTAGPGLVGPGLAGSARAPPVPLPSDAAGRPSLAVLPFRTPAPDPVPRHVADGLVDDVISALAGLNELTVISRGSTFRFRETELDLPTIGRDLGVRYVVSGSLRQSGQRMRVLGELAEAETGAVLSSRSFEGASDMMFDAQDDMVREIVRALAPRVRSEELRRIRIKPPENRLAYDYVLQARDLIYGLDRASFDQARAMLDQAMALDSEYAAAYALMAEYYSLRIGQSWSPDPASDSRSAERFAREAIERDPTNVRALARYGHSRAFLQRDYAGAIATFERALDLSPSNADAWMWSSCTYAYVGDGVEAIRRAELALRLSPRDWFGFQFHSALNVAHYTNGTYASAVQAGLACMADNPRYSSNLRYTIASLSALGELGQARALAEKLLAVEPGFRVIAHSERHPYRDQPRRELFRQHLLGAGLPA